MPWGRSWNVSVNSQWPLTSAVFGSVPASQARAASRRARLRDRMAAGCTPERGASTPECLQFVRMRDLIDEIDRKSTRLNSSHSSISYAVFCLKKKNTKRSDNYHYRKNKNNHTTT